MSLQSVEANQLLTYENSTWDTSYNPTSRKPFSARVASCFFFAACSLFSAFLNKSILTAYSFPSVPVVALSHMLVAVVVLYSLKHIGKIHYPHMHANTFVDIFPLPLAALGGALLSLGGIQQLSLPMLIMLRRFSIPLTMLAEYYMLNIRPMRKVQCAVIVIIFGAVLAAADDFSFNIEGYACTFAANCLGAYYDVYTKSRLEDNSSMGRYGLMYYCSLYCTPVLLLIIYYNGDLDVTCSFSAWGDPLFVLYFLLSAVIGLVVGYSYVLCTHYNSALGVNMVTCFKSTLVAYVGMYVATDHTYTWLGSLGMNLSLIGSFLYAYAMFGSTSSLPARKPVADL